jgi:hypothetical protein
MSWIFKGIDFDFKDAFLKNKQLNWGACFEIQNILIIWFPPDIIWMLKITKDKCYGPRRKWVECSGGRKSHIRGQKWPVHFGRKWAFLTPRLEIWLYHGILWVRAIRQDLMGPGKKGAPQIPPPFLARGTKNAGRGNLSPFRGLLRGRSRSKIHGSHIN